MKFGQAGGGNDDSVPLTSGAFSDAKKPATWIFLEGQDKLFALNLFKPVPIIPKCSAGIPNRARGFAAVPGIQFP